MPSNNLHVSLRLGLQALLRVYTRQHLASSAVRKWLSLGPLSDTIPLTVFVMSSGLSEWLSII